MKRSEARQPDSGRRRGLALPATLILALLLCGCPPQKPSMRGDSAGGPGRSAGQAGQTVVARINGETITRDDFDRRVAQLPNYVRARYRSTQKQQEYLTSLVQFELLADVAERQGLGDSPEVRRALEKALADRVLRDALREKISMEDIPKSAVEAAYRENIDDYREPAQRRAMILVTGSRERAERLRAKLAEHTYESVEKKVQNFRQAASESSVDASTARQGGDAGWVQPPDVETDQPRLAEVIFDLEEKGAISEVFQRGDRWLFATWYGETPARERSLQAVARDIRSELYEQRRRELRAELLTEWRKSADVAVEDGLADKLTRPDPPRLTRKEEIPIVPASAIEAGDKSTDSE